MKKVDEFLDTLGNQQYYLVESYKGTRYYNLTHKELLGYKELEDNCVYIARNESFQPKYCKVPYTWLEHGDYYIQELPDRVEIRQYNIYDEASDELVSSALPSSSIGGMMYELFELQSREEGRLLSSSFPILSEHY